MILDHATHLERGADLVMTDTPQVLLAHHLKTLKLPTFLREYDKIVRQCAAEGVDHVRYLLRLAELELIDRERRMVERRIRQASAAPSIGSVYGRRMALESSLFVIISQSGQSPDLVANARWGKQNGALVIARVGRTTP